MQKLKNILLVLIAVIAGYFVMVIGLYISQDAFFGGIVIGETPLWQVAIAGIGAFVSAFAGGWVAARLSPFTNWAPQIIMGLETIVESIYLFQSGKFPNPLWFDIGAEITLLVGIFAGGYYYLNKMSEKENDPCESITYYF